MFRKPRAYVTDRKRKKTHLKRCFIVEAEFNEVTANALQEDATQLFKGQDLIIDTPAPSGNNVSHFVESHVPAVSIQKPKPKARQAVSTLNDKTACVERWTHITTLALTYTHTRYCKATTTRAETKDTFTPYIEDPPNDDEYNTDFSHMAAVSAQYRNMKAEPNISILNRLLPHAF